MSRLPELYVAVDVEADGPIPGPYSMISLGMAVAGRPDLTFYSELRPISDEFMPAALAVSGLDRGRLCREAPAPEQAMGAAARWINGLRAIGRLRVGRDAQGDHQAPARARRGAAHAPCR
ncbi:hypothetical protein [Nonomuraea rosea]|uniref:hypothetical protein n=1 Tax=Nonomuraea rosea TaxID=638574 RepID=UPI0031EB6E3D